MKDANYKPDGTGVVMGDTRAMPDRGTGTGFNGDSYDADTSQEATNGMGKISGTKSNPADQCCAYDENVKGGN